MTIADKLATILTVIGLTEQPKSGKYRIFAGPISEGMRHIDVRRHAEQKYFIGRSGALRYGRSGTNSLSLTDTKTYKMMLDAFDAYHYNGQKPKEQPVY